MQLSSYDDGGRRSCSFGHGQYSYGDDWVGWLWRPERKPRRNWYNATEDTWKLEDEDLSLDRLGGGRPSIRRDKFAPTTGYNYWHLIFSRAGQIFFMAGSMVDICKK
mmetsp:Transcript_6304/g.12027  ORF Transcript_6304/g.12027 Transcript_6304/m.12027 type:complete len:107 (+) Transcript_6304:359-679(+)